MQKKRAFITAALIEEAVAMVLPAIEAATESGVLKRKDLCVEVFVATNSYIDADDLENCGILYTASFGNKEEWKDPYDKYARAKLVMSARTGYTSGELVRGGGAVLIEFGDTYYRGGVTQYGVTIAASGVQEHFDEMISYWILYAIIGLCEEKVANQIAKDDTFAEEA